MELRGLKFVQLIRPISGSVTFTRKHVHELAAKDMLCIILKRGWEEYRHNGVLILAKVSRHSEKVTREDAMWERMPRIQRGNKNAYKKIF